MIRSHIKYSEDDNNKQHLQRNNAQVILEFTFSFVALLLLLYGIIMAFRWAGASLAERRIAQDQLFNTNVNEYWDSSNWFTGPLRQLDADLADVEPMDMVFNGW